MSDKYAAFGSHLEIGTAQIETGLVVCPTGRLRVLVT